MAVERAGSPLTVREFFERQKDDAGCAYLGRSCWIVAHRGYFLLNALRFVEVVSGDDELTSILEMADRFYCGEGEFELGDAVRRNDDLGSRKRAPIGPNESLQDWTLTQITDCRETDVVFAELCAAGVDWAEAMNLVAVAVWKQQNPDTSTEPSKSDLAPFLYGDRDSDKQR
jgi:hypothetical protein